MLVVSPLGARVVSLRVPVGGSQREVTCGLDDEAYRHNRHFLGASVGRYANRIAHGHLPLDGNEHALATQLTGHTLHGGPDGFDKRRWNVAEKSARHVVLTLESPDGDQGFPGNLHAGVRYDLTEDGVAVTYSAQTDAPTVVCLTNHTYFALAGERGGDVREHRIQVAAEAYLPSDAELIPTGAVAEVSGTVFDLRRPTRLGEVVSTPELDGGLDHTFVLDSASAPQLRLASPEGDLVLELTTDQPGVQVYTGHGLDGGYDAYAGIALEPQVFPDSPHHPEWPSAVLRPGEDYRTVTRWRFRPGPA